MGLGRYVVDAIVLEGRSPSELAKEHGISRSWIYELVGRYRQGGYAALEPRSRRPRSCAHRTPPRVEGAILRLRRELLAAGHDAGPHTIAYHLARRAQRVPSVATIWRILRRRASSPRSLRSAHAPRSSAFRRRCPMSSGRATPRTGSWRTGPASRSSISSTTTRAWHWRAWSSRR